jgi:hypothetical protein
MNIGSRFRLSGSVVVIAPGVLKESIDQLEVKSIIHFEPHGYCIAGKATVKLTNDDLAALAQAN